MLSHQKAAFAPYADFGGLLQESQPVMLSGIVQSACVRVDEEGTEVAAATAIGCDTGCPRHARGRGQQGQRHDGKGERCRGEDTERKGAVTVFGGRLAAGFLV